MKDIVVSRKLINICISKTLLTILFSVESFRHQFDLSHGHGYHWQEFQVRPEAAAALQDGVAGRDYEPGLPFSLFKSIASNVLPHPTKAQDPAKLDRVLYHT